MAKNMVQKNIFGHTFFGHFVPIGLKLFVGTQETIINRLVVRNPSYDAYYICHF